jgi:signal transduction histidine kinase
MRKGYLWAALLLLAPHGVESLSAEPPIRQVLLLHSFDRGNLSLDSFTANFRFDLEQRAGGPVNFVQVVVGPTRFASAPEQSVIDYIQSMFAGHSPPDLIVTTGGPASVFARKNRHQLFPDAPLLLASIDQRFLGDAPLGNMDSAVAASNDFDLIIDDILQVLPQTRQVFMIVGNGPIRDFWRGRLEEDFKRFNGRVTFIWADELSFPDILRRSARLPPDSAIFFLTLGTDATGAAFADERAIADLNAAANAPLFAAHSVYLGSGIVGGHLLSINELSQRTADVAKQILGGAAPAGVRPPPQAPGRPVFDWRELRKWGIPESRLPPGSLVNYRGGTLWSQYRAIVLTAAAALVIQGLLILWLVLERRARRHAEEESRMNLALAADVSRRDAISALTTSISHELGQPLSAIRRNTEALQLMLSTEKSTHEGIEEVLVDIQADGDRAEKILGRHRMLLRSRKIQASSIDVREFVRDALALFSQDMKSRQIKTSVNLPSADCLIVGDPVLLEQVVVNLLMNARDAMVETPLERRHIQVDVEVDCAHVEVSVRDSGPGLPEDLIGKVFTPFVTTKPQGLGIGLAIARTIVDAHGGSIKGRNHPDGGAIFTVRLRTGETHGMLPAEGSQTAVTEANSTA